MCSIIPPISGDLRDRYRGMDVAFTPQARSLSGSKDWTQRPKAAVGRAMQGAARQATGESRGTRGGTGGLCKENDEQIMNIKSKWNLWNFWTVSAFQQEKMLENWGFDHQQIGGKCRGQLSTAFYSSHDSSIVSTDIDIYINFVAVLSSQPPCKDWDTNDPNVRTTYTYLWHMNDEHTIHYIFLPGFFA